MRAKYLLLPQDANNFIIIRGQVVHEVKNELNECNLMSYEMK